MAQEGAVLTGDGISNLWLVRGCDRAAKLQLPAPPESRTLHAARQSTIAPDDGHEEGGLLETIVRHAIEIGGRAAVASERARMAGEIHDGLSQAFLAVIMRARAARLDERVRKRQLLQLLEEIEGLAACGLEEARRSVFALQSACIEKGGLAGALERLLGSLTIPGGTRFVLANEAGGPELAPAVEHAAYRIVQEATQNALKHAGAREVTVRLARAGGQLRVRIEDDGDGLADNVIQRARERGGLRAMRERAEGCGGSFAMERGSPRGTRIDVLLPIERASG